MNIILLSVDALIIFEGVLSYLIFMPLKQKKQHKTHKFTQSARLEPQDRASIKIYRN